MKLDRLLGATAILVAIMGSVLLWGVHSKPDFSHEYVPQKRAITRIAKPCRWDDICNGGLSPARIQAQKIEQEKRERVH